MRLAAAMREVHNDVPRNVVKTGKTGKAKEAMLRAIAFSKAGQSKKDSSGSNYVSPNDLHTPVGVTGQGTKSWRRGAERVAPTGQETSFKNPSDLHNYPDAATYRNDRFPNLHMHGEQVIHELDMMKLPSVERKMNPVEACRKHNNAMRDKHTNHGRGKAGIVVSNEEAAADSTSKW